MRSKAFNWPVRITVVLLLALAIGSLAQSPSQVHLTGLINDYSGVKVKPPGPWEIRGEWSLNLKGDSGKADFSAALDMIHSDGWILTNLNPPANIDDPSTRSPHTHHITMVDGLVTQTGTGLQVSGPVTVTANGNPAPFGPNSTLQIDITGGQSITFSNIKLTFGGDAVVHFGAQPLDGVVRSSQ